MGDKSMSSKEILLCILSQPEPKVITDRIKKNYPGLELRWYQRHFGAPMTDLPSDLFKDITILYTGATFPATQADAPNLKYVHLFSAGTDRIIKHPLFTDTKIVFSNSSGVHGPQISEWVIMTALVHNHNYISNWESQKKKKWDKSAPFGVRDLVGQRLGVLGYGAIGRQTARVAKAMGMEVYAYTASKKETPDERADHGYIVPGTGDADGSIPTKWFSGKEKADLHEFLAQELDIVLVSVPLTPATRHMLSTAEFDVMSKHPPLISNIARGPIIDQKALVEALNAKKVAAATLDVTDPEPLPEDDPLWTTPNVIITPHISGGSTKYVERSFEILEINLDKLQKGEKCINEISRRKGY